MNQPRTLRVGAAHTIGFGLGIWNEAGQRLIEFCQENTLVIANTLFQENIELSKRVLIKN